MATINKHTPLERLYLATDDDYDHETLDRLCKAAGLSDHEGLLPQLPYDAAPELLEACKLALDEYEGNDSDQEYGQAMAALRAAIAKAEGK